MTTKLDTFFYGADTKTYVSYDVPKDSLTKRFDFSNPSNNINSEYALSSSNILGVIESIHDTYVIINCLIDKTINITQRRKFDIEPLKGVLDLFEGEGVEIKINTFAGKREFLYSKSDEAKELFEEPEDIFSKHKGSSFFSKNYEG